MGLTAQGLGERHASHSPPPSRCNTSFADNRALRQLWQTTQDNAFVRALSFSGEDQEEEQLGFKEEEQYLFPDGPSDAIEIKPQKTMPIEEPGVNSVMLSINKVPSTAEWDTLEGILMQWEATNRAQKHQADRWLRLPGSDAIVVPLSPVY